MSTIHSTTAVPIVASNAALAPVIDSSKLNAAASHLHHVPLTADNATDFGGISMHPGTFASGEPIAQAQQPLQQTQIQHPIIMQTAQPIIMQTAQPIIMQTAQPIIMQQPIQTEKPLHLPAGPVTPAGAQSVGSIAAASPGVSFWSEEQTEVLAKQLPSPTFVTDNSVLANRIQVPELRAEKEALFPVVQASPNELGSTHPRGAIIQTDRPARAELLQEKQALTHVQQATPNELGSIHQAGAAIQPTDLNHPVASELLAEKQILHHVNQPKPNELGSVHAPNAIVQTGELNHPAAAALLAEKAALHHVKLDKAPVTASGGAHLIAQPPASILPSQLATIGGEVAQNAGLAPLVQSAELNKAHKQLQHVDAQKELVPSTMGSQHPAGAQLGHAAIDAAALQHVRDTQLQHVKLDKAATTLSGGKHLLGQPDTTLVPEELGALSGLIQPAQLQAAHKQLDSVPAEAHTQPSRYGGMHSAGAQTGVIADATALQFVKAHELNHVNLSKAPVTASGGQHLIAQPDSTLIPEQAASSAPHHAALAGVVSTADLRSEKRALEHVPIERQHATATGALNMRDSAATEPLSILDRFKSVLGFETSAEQRAHNEPAPGLGRVVERVPVAIESHTIETPAQAVHASTKLAEAPQNAQLAQIITPRDLRLESTQLLPVAGSAALAPVISEGALQAEHAQLNHVGGISSEKTLAPAPVLAAAPIDEVVVVSRHDTVPLVSAQTGQLAGVVDVQSITIAKVPAAGEELAVAKDIYNPALSAPKDEYTQRNGGEQSYAPIR